MFRKIVVIILTFLCFLLPVATHDTNVACMSKCLQFYSPKDFYPLYLANYILGESGLTSRLNKIIREENGFTYGVYTTLTYGDAAALIRGGFSADYTNYEKAKELLLKEWQKMAKNR